LNAHGPLPFDTERLRLRRLHEGDLQVFQIYRSDAEVGRWQGWSPMTSDAARAFLREMATSPWCPRGEWFQLAIADLASNTLLGDMGLLVDPAGHTVDLGFTLSRAAQGQGLAAEAVNALVPLLFRHTPARRVRAIADVRNASSLKLLQRTGFKCYATLAATFRGEACEEHCFVRYPGDVVTPELRKATAADAPAVATVLIESRLALMPFAPSAHSDEDLHGWVAHTLIPQGGVTVATLQGAIVGVLATQVRDPIGWIDQLMVDPLHVQRGIGRALLQHALQQLQTDPGTAVQLYTFQANQAARRFYEAQGFRAVAFTDGADNEERCPDVLYRLGPSA
jgi:RimJ/RimL family protein N-acetyltransferase